MAQEKVESEVFYGAVETALPPVKTVSHDHPPGKVTEYIDGEGVRIGLIVTMLEINEYFLG